MVVYAGVEVLLFELQNVAQRWSFPGGIFEHDARQEETLHTERMAFGTTVP